MALAQRLNELASANLEGLLNDDEYRLLRQNAFEEYSGNVAIPVEAPIVPMARVRVQLRGGSSPKPNQRRTTPKASPDRTKPPPSSARAKAIVTSGVANLLRRATGRRTPSPFNNPTTTKDACKNDGVEHSPKDVLKRSLLVPQFHKKKTSKLPPLLTEVPRPLIGTVNSPKSLITVIADEHRNPPSSPTPSSRHIALPLSPRHPEKSISSIRNVFDDDSLKSANDIRSAIALTEDEGHRLVEAFNNLECTTIRRVQKQKAHRLPASTPANINILLGGKEWREHRLISSPSSPLFESRYHILSSVESNSDGISIRSASSNRTSLSRSKSISSLRPPVSPLSPHFCAHSGTIPRKNSVSSVSSQVPSAVMRGVTNPSSLSKSTSHLALRRLKGSQMSISTETVGQASSDREDDDEDVELVDIRKRREDLVSRYTARLEFLKAKLKGAELHEKLLRK